MCREDVITLQNPHGLPPASIPNKTAAAEKAEKAGAKSKAVATKPAAAAPVAKTKATTPCK